MTRPQQQLPGTVYLLTKRMRGRRCFAVPSEIVNATFLYLVALASARTGVIVCAYCFLGNHVHLVIWDRFGRRSDFARLLFRWFTVARNDALGRRGPMWEHECAKASPLADEGAALQKILYTMNQGVGHFLVRDQRSYPGLWSPPEDVGRMQFVPRPVGAFWDEFKGPKVIPFRLGIPPSLQGWAKSLNAYRELLEDARLADEHSLRLRNMERNRTRRLEGKRPRSYLGVGGILSTTFGHQPPDDGRPNFEWIGMAATMAARRALREARRAFLRWYDATRRKWQRGDKSATWPPGTYAMVRFYGGLLDTG